MRKSRLSAFRRAQLATTLLLGMAGVCATALAQSTGTAAGNAAGAAAFSVVLRMMKGAKPTVSMSPKRLDFTGVSVGKSALNVVAITNGTNSAIEIESVATPSGGFRVASSLTLPLAIPPQTEALLTLEFLPTRAGTENSTFEIRYRTSGKETVRKEEITLRGKGVQQ